MAIPQKLINGLGELGIEQMQEYLERYAEMVNKGEKSFSDALDELVDIERKHRQIRRDAANLHVANFPFVKTLDDFDFSFQPNINKKELLELNSLGFVENKENVLFLGTSGVGKTHLATAIGISCTKARYQTYFITFENLITQLKKAHQENRLENRLKFYAKYKVLIIDEIGYMPIDQDTANIFFQLIAKRYEKNSTIITTNMPFSKWGDFFGSSTLANAVLDRLLHHSTVISIKGPSYRTKDIRALLEAQAAEE
ncbi:MAG: IS21-like element helper ATPase IstB [Lachnospiraceae bacterium]|nr:IS21-like element helper ATPase IstB [Lachnospiraceae bacterium]MCQ2548391.1 IS21-like element helper ATPase IstB [Clostridia bacterium]